MTLCLIVLVPAILMMAMTFIEGMADGNRFDAPRLIGLAACLVWPISLPLLLILSGLHVALNAGRLPKLTTHTDVIARRA